MTVQNIEIDPAAAMLTLHFEGHSNSYKLAELNDWLAFYRKQCAVFPKSRAKYEAIIDALENVGAKQVDIEQAAERDAA